MKEHDITKDGCRWRNQSNGRDHRRNPVRKTGGAAVLVVTGAAQATVRAGVTYSTTGEACAYVTADAGVTYSTTGAGGTCSVTTGADSKTGAVTNIGMCGFCWQRRSDLDNLHNLGLCHPADRCNAQTLTSLSATICPVFVYGPGQPAVCPRFDRGCPTELPRHHRQYVHR